MNSLNLTELQPTDKIILKVEAFSYGVDVIYKEPSNQTYCCNPPRPVPDRIYKLEYRIEDGKLVLKAIVEGKYSPPQYVPESYEF